MMVANLKSYRKIIIAVLFLSSCSPKDITPPKRQAVIVVDKTSSIVYTKLAQLEQKIALNIKQTYDSATSDIQLSLLKITGNPQVIPAFDRFEEKYPEDEDGGRTYEEELLRWKAKKKMWISDEERQIDSLVEGACKSNTTDIFSTFKGIQQAQQNHGPWGSVNVYILSDMTNTSRPFNMLKMKSLDSAFNRGKVICQDLINQGQISAGNTENLHLIIYTPDNMQKPDLVMRFWEGFFEQWGLKVSQYQFENE